MGFLDHSTNNIILDAVLTDAGRQILSQNDGSFSISKFALGDDEVNYSIIKKYGRTVGKEKIEKNTPIFEALTDQSQAQKYMLTTVSNPTITKIPKFLLTGDQNLTGGTLQLNTVATQGKFTQGKLSLSQNILNESTVPVELRDETFIVDLPHMFLRLNGNFSPNSIDRMQRAQYIVTKSRNNTNNGGSSLEVTVAARNLSSQIFDVYGTGTGKNTIKTYVRITGRNSGTVRDIPIEIKR